MKSERPLPRRAGESPSERRFREAINRACSQALQAIDGAIGLRTTEEDVARTRNRARGHLTDFAAQAMIAFHIAKEKNLAEGD